MLCDGFTYFSQIVGVTTAVPDEVPDYLPPLSGASNNEWYYYGNTLYHDNSNTYYSDLPSLDDFEVGNKIGLLLLPNGELYLFLDGKNSAQLATGLPVHKSLFGTVDLYGRCTKIKSEILSGELDGVCLCTDGMKWTLHYCYLWQRLYVYMYTDMYNHVSKIDHSWLKKLESLTCTGEIQHVEPLN